jgi:hypothetical protein
LGLIYLGNGDMDFLYSGVADCTGWAIACSGGEGEEVKDSVKEIDDILRAYTCPLRGGRLGIPCLTDTGVFVSLPIWDICQAIL